jgi:sterol desaturase/sphingolipid hydroxylase (fatty acid hydroxylase superfamily)
MTLSTAPRFEPSARPGRESLPSPRIEGNRVFAHRLVTPQFHRIHHSADAKEGNSNFGVMLPIWDMMFGTHVDPVTTEVREAGIQGDPIPHRWLAELSSPIRRFETTAKTD